MSMREVGGPVYTFHYEVLSEPIIRFVKDSKNNIFKVRINKYITRREVSPQGNSIVYASYDVDVEKKTFWETLFNKPGIKEWVNIEPNFYIPGLYVMFSPSGVVFKEHLYIDEKSAMNGNSSYIFRSKNRKEK